MRAGILGIAIALLATSCAYYNTFYLARKYYDRATGGWPYPVERPDASAANNFNKSIDYSKKVIAIYPKSKWVDKAYLLWARALLGREDPGQTVNMLREFSSRYPESREHETARFYLGVGYRQSRKPAEAVASFDTFLALVPKHELVPYAHLERARALTALERHAEAAEAAGLVVTQFSKSRLVDQARMTRAEALLAGRNYEAARTEYRAMGLRARTDDERFTFLLKEADALEAARDFEAELSLLRGALAHEVEPTLADTAAVRGAPGTAGARGGFERWGRLQIRIGAVHTLAGRQREARQAFDRVVAAFPGSHLAAEAQYRIGYVLETVADDFESARAEYAKVQLQSGSSQFVTQAGQRLANLERLSQLRGAGADSLARHAEAGFLLAEQYLFQLDKPDRALEQYWRIEKEHAGTPHAAKAMTGAAWVLREKFKAPSQADSIWWQVVRRFPATEAQLAARDYLERDGHVVPDSLIVMPTPPPPDTTAADSVALTPPPEGLFPLEFQMWPVHPDSIVGPMRDEDRMEFTREFGRRGGPSRHDPLDLIGPPVPGLPAPPRDTSGFGRPIPAARDTSRRPPLAPPDTSAGDPRR